jgi:hypothetical protein
MGGSSCTDASIPPQVAYPPGHRTLGAAQMSSIVQRLVLKDARAAGFRKGFRKGHGKGGPKVSPDARRAVAQ